MVRPGDWTPPGIVMAVLPRFEWLYPAAAAGIDRDLPARSAALRVRAE
jgi:hypothetical protein